MAEAQSFDPVYVAARRVLLDALTLLAPHGKAVVVVGAQAVYLRTGEGDVSITIAPYTTDGDLALDPALLKDEPDLEALMTGAGFSADHPGMWQTTVLVGGEDVIIQSISSSPREPAPARDVEVRAFRHTAGAPLDVLSVWRRRWSTTAQ